MRFDPSRVRVSGPLGRYAVALGDQLLQAGYPPERVVRHVQLLAQLSRWMEARGVGEAELCEERLVEFLEARRVAGYWGAPSVGWLSKLLGRIPGLEVTPAPLPAPTAAELLIDRYCHHLRQERGLATSTIRGYVDHARRFVSRFEDADGELDLPGVTAEAVISFVVDQRRHRCLGSAAKAVTVLRSLLRFLSLEGLVPTGLADAVPAVSVCKGYLPRALSSETVAALLDSCNNSSPMGKRDLAISTLLIRLGLRSGEVARLTLDDLDWNHGELVVRGKGSRQERLPLPVDVGEALVAYLDGGRPAADCRAVFLRVKAPITAMTSSAVTQTVASACKRAGLAPVGAHRLRHSAATTMLHAGVPLADVGQVLRQTALSTTAIYAKVDRVALRAFGAALARSTGVSALHVAVDDYIAIRRSLGFRLVAYPWMLHDFVEYLESHGESKITTHLALEWAQLPGAGSHLSYLRKRLCVVRGFARHQRAFDPDTEVPAAYLMGWQSCRAIPYIYSEADIEAVMSAAGSLTPELRAATYQTLVGLLFVTGARVGEMIRLDRDDIGWDDAVVIIRYSKFAKSRELPVHPSTLDALRHYAEVRDRLCPEPETSSFFVNTLGRRLAYETVHQVFNKLTDAASLRARSDNCRPRIHDIRHSLACATLIGWYRNGVDMQAQLPLLSAWLGHAKPENSYWYLSAIPELLALAAQRRQLHRGRNRS